MRLVDGVTARRAASPATARWRTHGPTRRRSRPSPATQVPPRALWLRALLLERERIANHLGDLGYLGNDAGFAFGLAQFSRLKEDVLRTNLARVRPSAADGRRRPGRRRPRPRGGARPSGSAPNALRSRARCGSCATSTTSTRASRTGSAPAGASPPELARAARPHRTRRPRERPGARPALRLPGCAPYDTLDVRKITATDGDVAARVAVRFDEIAESLRLVAAILERAARRRRRVARRPRRPEYRPASASSKAGAARAGRADQRARQHDPPLPSARSVVAELAGARARDHRQHRSRLPADQQVVQPLATAATTSRRQHAAHPQADRASPASRPSRPPAPDDDDGGRRAGCRSRCCARSDGALTIRHVDAGSCNGCELEIHALGNPYYNLEGLGIRFVASPRHADMLLVTGPVSQAHGDRAPAHVRRDARAQARRRGRRLRLHRRHLRRELREPRPRRQRDSGRRRDPGLPADAHGAPAGHPRGDHQGRPRGPTGGAALPCGN